MTTVSFTQRSVRFRPAPALRLEIKHSAVVWVLPILAALFYYNAYRTATGYPPTWTLRASVITGPNLIFFSVIAAGIASWVATRESRRKTGDLLATTARAAWSRQATVFAATAFWMVLAYLAGVAVIYIQTALQATWGGPPLWPVAVGVVGVAASCAVGFTCGTLFPGRFTAPVVAVVVFVAWFIGVAAANNVNNFVDVSRAKGTAALFVSTDGGRPRRVDVGVYYHVPPDVSIAQVMFMGGVLLVMAGLIALLPTARVPGGRGPAFAGRRWLTVVAAVGLACGVAASATAVSLAGTARYSVATGWEIPALHDAADDQPIPYEVKTTPVPPAPAAASASAARRLAAGAGLAWLHLRSRRVPSALLLALALCGGALRAVLRSHLMSGGALAQQGPMIIEAGAAVLIAITTHSPFGEAERATGRWLPYLRLGTALALTGVAIGALQLGATGASLPGGVLMLARNVIGITGIGLLASLVTGGLLAWIPPLGYLGFAEYALTAAWRNPWTWPVRPPADRGAWICAVLVFAVGLAAITFRGARTSPADNA